ncbi:type I-E CRISPR-associated protein Cas6/Cse3/CasE [Secundilactobacillus paracollinoides]|uniref:Type I-E CRISPR-associated protein Cas6/Cse3/CasE n=1 Tax=Secundilactobacillus paracollinoides TaxID=240427 RepID=A0A1B2IY72_9LACO|nr:type I-E CRISPR-associated protein Cas6/Cse3/CasE [Secundilactobacillus paracollinoides]ANZ61104.1 type I-E CRISPR-associated protein Cas6/Cse3/CasE [Secundilactobacillus paracollinoides]ANZ67026.1 type I-E CRISPR-associated protein Cas6/Cse3/CasE [Secundilactobacillus paracollinoides]
MYLSRVEIDVNNRRKTKDLTHLGAYHNWIEQSFPEEIAANERQRHLWRIDQLNGKKYLLLLSQEAPDTEALARYGVGGSVQTKSYDQFLNGINDGELMRFRLTANPVHAVPQPGKNQPKIYPHIKVDQQKGWLIKRADKLGFELIKKQQSETIEDVNDLAFDIVSRDWPRLARKQSRGAKLSRVSFEGMLRVTDAVTFRQTLVNGIGKEKAFGMGLMTVIPV